jgi:hypothetical protein
MIAKAGQVHWRSVQVTSESMESFGVVGIDRRVIMNVETRMAPRKQQVDALFGDEVPVSEQSEELMTKGQLGFVGIDIGDGMPLPVREEDPTSDDSMNVRIPFQRRSKRLNDGDHSWPGVGLIRSCRHHLADGLVGESCEIS